MPKSGRSYHLRKFESGDVEIKQAFGVEQCSVTIHCKEIDGDDAIELNFDQMNMDRVIGLLTPFRFEIREFEDDAA